MEAVKNLSNSESKRKYEHITNLSELDKESFYALMEESLEDIRAGRTISHEELKGYFKEKYGI